MHTLVAFLPYVPGCMWTNQAAREASLCTISDRGLAGGGNRRLFSKPQTASAFCTQALIPWTQVLRTDHRQKPPSQCPTLGCSGTAGGGNRVGRRAASCRLSKAVGQAEVLCPRA